MSMRRLPIDVEGDTTNTDTETSRPLIKPLNQMIAIAFDSDEEVLLGGKGIPQPPASVRYVRQVRATRTDRPVTLGYSCLLIPMCFAAWWYWTRRKARRVLRLLRNASSSTNQGEEEDDDSPIDDNFSTWEDVVENETPDPSVRFVKWLNDGGSARRRASVNRATKRTMAKMSKHNSDNDVDNTPLEERYQDEPDSESPVLRGWQCLQDAGGFELCTMGHAPSYDDPVKLDRDQEQGTYTYTTEKLWTP